MTQPRPIRLAVMGAGMIGRRHIAQVLACAQASLAAIVDLAPRADLPGTAGVPWYSNLAAMLAADRPDGVLVATPNRLHVENGLACIAAGLPALIEKPIAEDIAGAEKLVSAAEQASVPLLVGHHRRHNPLVQQARQVIESGRLGRIVAVHTTCWFYKPDAYFDVAWRREKGAGPVIVNMIHDVDLLRFLCGEVLSVQAVETNATRGHAVEDTAAVLLRFASGALGTITVSDTVVAPWSWEFTSGENPAYTHTPEICTMIGGTRGSLTIPRLDLWHHPTKPDWWEPLVREPMAVEPQDPLALQIANFCAVIAGQAQPVVSGREGLNTLKVMAAIKQAAASGHVVAVA